jgi:phosphopantothenoylcysteine decarboxylase/phosphopantothenate--cysteine ligase
MANPVQGKRVLLGVTGSIAAYKAVEIASRLTQWGAQVDTVLTESAQKFVTPLTFQSVTGRKAYTDADLWGGEGHVTHVGLGRAADLLVIAPASANTLAKLAQGLGDNLLSLTALACQCPVLVVPAMDAGMYEHPATQANVDVLKARGVYFLGPEEGHLASGLSGPGRMVEPYTVISQVRYLLSRNGPLAGKKLVISAGGTQEVIDPVRILTNRSSGKQGLAIAQAALDAGGDVTLVTTTLGPLEPVASEVILVKSAAEMLSAILESAEGADVLIMAAAVADFRPSRPATDKIKKRDGVTAIELEPTTDILKAVAAQKRHSGYPRFTVGFAAESKDLLDNARVKLTEKGLDMIVANDISNPRAGFEVDDNQVTLLFPDGSAKPLQLMSKEAVAEAVLQKVITWF